MKCLHCRFHCNKMINANTMSDKWWSCSVDECWAPVNWAVSEACPLISLTPGFHGDKCLNFSQVLVQAFWHQNLLDGSPPHCPKDTQHDVVLPSERMV